MVVTLVRFRRMGNLHLYSTKVAGVLGYLFAIHLFVFGSYSPPVFWVVWVAVLVASTETLVLALTREQVSEGIGSIIARHPR